MTKIDYFSFRRVLEYFPQLVSHLPATLLIAVMSIVAGLVIGTLIAVVRLFRIPVLYQLAGVYISFIRGVPINIQLFIVFYGFPMLLSPLFMPLGVNLNAVSPIIFVIITYALSSAAFLSVLISGSILGVERGQTEAALSVGMTRPQLFRRVIMPQAYHIALPELGNNIIMTLKDTSLAFTVGVLDMVGIITAIAARTKHSLEGYVGAAVIYFVICFLLEKAFARIEKKNKVYK
jgi:L-cystine transport system permease protein